MVSVSLPDPQHKVADQQATLTYTIDRTDPPEEVDPKSRWAAGIRVLGVNGLISAAGVPIMVTAVACYS